MDKLKKILSENGEALIYAIDATETIQDSMLRLQAFPPAMAHLGQAMMSALLLQAMGADKDGMETVAMEWMVKGPFGHLYAEARNFGEVRGTIQNAQAAVFDYTTKLGPGQLRVRRTRSVATTSLISAVGDVVLDSLQYLEQSEQRSVGMNLSVSVLWKDPQNPQAGFQVERAIGYLIDILPQQSRQDLEDALVRWDRRMREISQMSHWVLDAEDRVSGILQLISGELKPNILLEQRVVFACQCSEERAERAVALANSQEGQVAEGPQEVRCEYCGKVYTISD